MKLGVLSPYLDDAVLSLGQTLAAQSNATIITVLAGIPADDGRLTPYDKMCGFTTSAESVTVRREENDWACTVLGVEHVEGDWLDGQYDEPPDPAAVTAWLAALMADCDAVLIPVGIGHRDHEQVAAWGHTAAIDTGTRIGVYLECPWYVRHPRDSVHALDRLAEQWALTPAELPVGPRDVKRLAVEAHTSQLGEDLRAHVYTPEHVWWLD